MSSNLDNKKAACATYIEQTKLLVTLASAFIVAPAALVTLIKAQNGALVSGEVRHFVIAELLFVASVLAGYVVLGTLSGSQDAGDFDVFRTATRTTSLLQLLFYLGGIVVFVLMVVHMV